MGITLKLKAWANLERLWRLSVVLPGLKRGQIVVCPLVGANISQGAGSNSEIVYWVGVCPVDHGEDFMTLNPDVSQLLIRHPAEMLNCSAFLPALH